MENYRDNKNFICKVFPKTLILNYNEDTEVITMNFKMKSFLNCSENFA